MALHLELFIFGTCDTDDYDEAALKIKELSQYFVNKVFGQYKFVVEDTGAGHICDHKFIVDLEDDLLAAKNGIKKFQKLLKNKPFTYSKIRKTDIQQITLSLYSENAQYIMYDWDQFRSYL